MTKAQIEAFKKITPGPWSAEWDDNGQWYVEPLGLTGTHLRGDSGECIESANAISIAALPDLLAEREKMIAAMKHALYRGHDYSDFCDKCEDLEKLLAEAEGGE